MLCSFSQVKNYEKKENKKNIRNEVMYQCHQIKHDRRNDDMPLSHADNKKTQLKILLEKIKHEENDKINNKSKKKEINSRSGNVKFKEKNDFKNYTHTTELDRNPANMSVIKKELSTLQSTIDNLEKKLCIILIFKLLFE